MIEIAHSREKGILKNIPQEVQEAIERILEGCIRFCTNAVA